jgi:hypothetical protein
MPGNEFTALWGRRLLPRLNWIIPSSGWLRGLRWFETDVSGLPTGLVFTDNVVQAAWSLKTEGINSPVTSVSSHLTPCNNPEDRRIQCPVFFKNVQRDKNTFESFITLSVLWVCWQVCVIWRHLLDRSILTNKDHTPSPGNYLLLWIIKSALINISGSTWADSSRQSSLHFCVKTSSQLWSKHFALIQ